MEVARDSTTSRRLTGVVDQRKRLGRRRGCCDEIDILEQRIELSAECEAEIGRLAEIHASEVAAQVLAHDHEDLEHRREAVATGLPRLRERILPGDVAESASSESLEVALHHRGYPVRREGCPDGLCVGPEGRRYLLADRAQFLQCAERPAIGVLDIRLRLLRIDALPEHADPQPVDGLIQRFRVGRGADRAPDPLRVPRVVAGNRLQASAPHPRRYVRSGRQNPWCGPGR